MFLSMLKNSTARASLVILLVLLITGAALPQISTSGIGSISSDSRFSSSMDYWPTNGWRNTTPAEQNMSSIRLQEMLDYIDSENYPIISMAVVRHGYMVLEEYMTEYRNENSTQFMYSVTKSFTSALIGIALAQGYIDNLS